ncbi:MAG: copper resistance CopC/CopD family protein [Gaiellales bacterium]
MRSRIAALAVAAMAVAAALPATAEAHATLISSTPAAGGVVARAPHQVVLKFDEPVQPVKGGTDVVTSAGRSVLGGPPHTAAGDGRELVIPLQSGLGDGDYTVRWRIVSTDGHLISGVLAFGVGLGRPPPQASTTESSSTDWPYLIARFAYFAGLVLLIGGAVFRVAVSAPAMARLPAQRRAMASLRESHRATQLLTLAAALMLGGGWVALTRQGSEVAGVSFWQAFNHSGPVGSALQATRFGREFGRGIDIAAAFVVAAAVAFAIARRWPRAAIAAAVPAALLGAWTVVVPGLSGHAGDAGRGTLAVVVDAAHVAAASIWIGGLAQLVIVVPHMLRGLSGAELERTRSAIVRRFSLIAIGCAAAIAVTGVSRALWEVSAVSQLWSTGYGRALAIKTVLFAAALTLGYRNRRALDRFTDVRRRAFAELGLLGGVLAAVAVLTNLPPANTPLLAVAAGPAGGPAVVPLAGDARLAVWPGRAGPNWIAVWPRSGDRVRRVALHGPDGAVGVTLHRVGDADVALLPNLPTGTYAVSSTAGSASIGIGPAARAPVPTPPLAGQGAVAAEEASDLAVGLQRIGAGTARVTLIGQSGQGVPTALVTASGHTGVPCGQIPACYQVPVTSSPEVSTVVVLRPGRAAVRTAIRLPGADAAPAAGLLRRAAAAYRALRSVRSENLLSSDPTHAVSTTFISQSPNRLSIDVHGGERSIIIGAVRYDLRPDGTWKRSPAVPTPQPNPFWAPNATAVHVAGRSGHTVQLTLAIPGGPTFFRLWMDERTRLVTRLRMITAAHFMWERELDFNSAPPVLRPRVP